jgi:hypothetical protein
MRTLLKSGKRHTSTNTKLSTQAGTKAELTRLNALRPVLKNAITERPSLGEAALELRATP